MRRFIMFIVCSLVINSMSFATVFGMKALTACFSCLCSRKKQPVNHVRSDSLSIREQLTGEMGKLFSDTKSAIPNIIRILERYQQSGGNICAVLENFEPRTRHTILHHIAEKSYMYAAELLGEILKVYQSAGGNVVRLIEMRDEKELAALQIIAFDDNHGRYKSGVILTLLTCYHNAGGNIDPLVFGLGKKYLNNIDFYEHWSTILEIIITYASLGGDAYTLIQHYAIEVQDSNLAFLTCDHRNVKQTRDLLLVPGVNYNFLTKLLPILFSQISHDGGCNCFTQAITEANAKRPVLNALLDADNRALEQSIQDTKNLVPALGTVCAQYCFKQLIRELPAGLLKPHAILPPDIKII